MSRELFKLKSETRGMKFVLSVSRKNMVSDSLFDNEIKLHTIFENVEGLQGGTSILSLIHI